MGEIADMMLDGTLCEQCGTFIEEGEAGGFPRLCTDCDTEQKPPQQKRSKKEPSIRAAHKNNVTYILPQKERIENAQNYPVPQP